MHEQYQKYLAPFHPLHDLDLVLDLAGNFIPESFFHLQGVDSLGLGKANMNILPRRGAATALIETGWWDLFESDIRDVAVFGEKRSMIGKKIDKRKSMNRDFNMVFKDCCMV